MLLLLLLKVEGFVAFEHRSIKIIEHRGIYRSQCKGVCNKRCFSRKNRKRFLLHKRLQSFSFSAVQFITATNSNTTGHFLPKGRDPLPSFNFILFQEYLSLHFERESFQTSKPRGHFSSPSPFFFFFLQSNMKGKVQQHSLKGGVQVPSSSRFDSAKLMQKHTIMAQHKANTQDEVSEEEEEEELEDASKDGEDEEDEGEDEEEEDEAMEFR